MRIKDKIIMLWSFAKDIVKCLLSKYTFTFCLIGVVGVTVYTCVSINAANKQFKTIINPEKAIYDSLLKVKKDSMAAQYDHLEKRVEQAEQIVGNYQSDADVFIGKTTSMFSIWLAVSTGFVAIVIGLSVWNNYRQEKSAEKVKRELECTAQINKIGSIMTCLNSLPDPLLTDSEAERRQYVKNNIDLLYHEFSVYAKLVGKNPEHSDYDLRYIQLVLSVMKIAVIRVQNVFSDKNSNVAFYTFSSSLEKSIKGIQDGSITHKEIRNSLKNVQGQFDRLRVML